MLGMSFFGDSKILPQLVAKINDNKIDPQVVDEIGRRRIAGE